MLSAFEYIKYLLASRKRHGVHSPFIYQLTDKCLERSYSEDDHVKIKRFKELNKSNPEILTITDHGVGSKHMNNLRSVKDIYKNSSSKGKYGKLLYQLSKHYEPQRILELGTSLGNGTLQLSLGNPKTLVTTIEGCPDTVKTAQQNFDKLGLKNIELINSTFDNFLSTLTDASFDLVFIDGHHDGTALLKYLEALEPFIHEKTIMVLDDIRWSKSMFKAWKQIVSNDRYHVTIDLFRVGLITKRPQQHKEHFIIRM
jgi:predicted O-methyltransferase YrrM